ncbi:hypothetical protein WN944_027914 [Citrus x changshan-huyou]|uniref:Thioredoxin domain-containing protein n=1 Tax=Citrus x changshan-huyou TaxID=2935761 RepID=A0AAP0LJJ8_9ROSI
MRNHSNSSFALNLTSLVLLLSLSLAMIHSKSEVITLTPDTFTDKVKEKDTAWFVKFCVPWCKHCKNLGSLWEDLGKAMEGDDEIEVGEVDCGASKTLCSKVDIHSYPTFKETHTLVLIDPSTLHSRGYVVMQFLVSEGLFQGQGMLNRLKHLFWKRQKKQQQKHSLVVTRNCDKLWYLPAKPSQFPSECNGSILTLSAAS